MTPQHLFFPIALQAGIIIYRGLYFGLYDTLKPMLLTGQAWCIID